MSHSRGIDLLTPQEIQMTSVNVPTREEVSADNQAIFDNLKKGLGMVPNLYATFAHSETALANYLAFQMLNLSFESMI